MAITPASQAVDVSSILITRSNKKKRNQHERIIRRNPGTYILSIYLDLAYPEDCKLNYPNGETHYCHRR